MDERRGLARRVMAVVVTCLLAGICYSLGFNSGWDEGEGRAWRRQIRRIQEYAEARKLDEAEKAAAAAVHETAASVEAETGEDECRPLAHPAADTADGSELAPGSIPADTR